MYYLREQDSSIEEICYEQEHIDKVWDEIKQVIPEYFQRYIDTEGGHAIQDSEAEKLSERVDLTLSNLSILKTGKAKAIRFSTLDAICKALDCQPGDILEYVNDKEKTTNR
jgi:putative transcriptional regulator